MIIQMFSVLVTDDHRVFRTHLSKYMRQQGYHVKQAKNGEQALHLANDCDVAFLDVLMPGISGLEVSRRLATLVPHMRRVVISGVPEKILEARTQPASYDAFYEKPVEFDKLINENVIPEVLCEKMPFERALMKLKTALVEMSDLVGKRGKRNTGQLPVSLKNIADFARSYFWDVSVPVDARRGALLLTNALRGLSFVPSRPSAPYCLVEPSEQIIHLLIRLVESLPDGKADHIDRIFLELDACGVAVSPDFGEEIDDYHCSL